MMDLMLGSTGGPRSILCIGAHCDDIEIGCGGTLLQLQKSRSDLRVDWVVLTGSPARRAEASASMKKLVPKKFRGELLLGDFPDARLPGIYVELKDFFDDLRSRFNPDLLFSHWKDDAHQDHRITSELTWGAFRDHLILEYEIPKWDGDLTTPNFYVPLGKDAVQRKIDVLMSVYGSQRSKDWFTEDTFMALMRLRGLESRASSHHAEGFHVRKAVLGLTR